MKVNQTIAIVITLLGLLMGGLVAGVFLNRQPLSVKAAPSAQEQPTCIDDDDLEHEAENEAEDDIEDSDACEDNNADQAQTGITADEAKAAAEAAYPGTRAKAVELERESGKVIYEVELDNGLEVILDAGNGNILGTE